MLRSAEFWVGVSFVVFLAILLYFKVPALLAKALDDRAEGIRRELDEARKKYSPAHPDVKRLERKVAALETDLNAAAKRIIQSKSFDNSILCTNESVVVAEESIAAAVGTFVLDEVLVQIAEWRAAGVPFGSIAINATLGDFRSPRFVDQILTAISAGRIAKGDICVEITEGMLLGRGGKRARAEIVRLADAGLRVAFDDFGTGFASLSHLRDLPIDLVKIDKSFVMALEETSNRAIVTSVIDLAHRLGKKVTAEGVETTQQAAILKALGCDNIQGFLMAPALPSGSVALFLAQPPCRSLGLP